MVPARVAPCATASALPGWYSCVDPTGAMKTGSARGTPRKDVVVSTSETSRSRLGTSASWSSAVALRATVAPSPAPASAQVKSAGSITSRARSTSCPSVPNVSSDIT